MEQPKREKNLDEFEERIEPGAFAAQVGQEVPLRWGVGVPLLGTARIVADDEQGLSIEFTLAIAQSHLDKDPPHTVNRTTAIPAEPVCTCALALAEDLTVRGFIKDPHCPRHGDRG